jgi:hypothetical protein
MTLSKRLHWSANLKRRLKRICARMDKEREAEWRKKGRKGEAPSPLYHTIKQPVATRWNSVATLLESVSGMEAPLKELVETATPVEGIAHCLITDDHWKMFGDLLPLLKVRCFLAHTKPFLTLS